MKRFLLNNHDAAYHQISLTLGAADVESAVNACHRYVMGELVRSGRLIVEKMAMIQENDLARRVAVAADDGCAGKFGLTTNTAERTEQ